MTTTAWIVLYVNALIVGAALGAIAMYVILSRRSAGQIVGASRRGQPVAAATQPVAELPARKLTAEEQAEWDRKQKHRILAKLAVDFPAMSAGKRDQAADELLAKARSVLARAG